MFDIILREHIIFVWLEVVMLPFTSYFSSAIVRKDAQLALLQNELDEHDRAPLIYKGA